MKRILMILVALGAISWLGASASTAIAGGGCYSGGYRYGYGAGYGGYYGGHHRVGYRPYGYRYGYPYRHYHHGHHRPSYHHPRSYISFGFGF